METGSVYDRIREKIVRNDLRPGTKINIDALVRELGVSQTPVREALHHLEGDGLVERVKGRG
jgi:DNA-binding GntR family transcriptional regulator